MSNLKMFGRDKMIALLGPVTIIVMLVAIINKLILATALNYASCVWVVKLNIPEKGNRTCLQNRVTPEVWDLLRVSVNG